MATIIVFFLFLLSAMMSFVTPAVVFAQDSPHQQADSLYHAAIRHLGVQHRGLAERDLRLALSLDSTHYEARVSLARIYRTVRRPEAAEALLVDAAAMNPRRVEAFFELGQLRSDVGDLAGAVGFLRRVVVLDSTLQAAYTGLGQALMKPSPVMDLAAAAMAFDRALILDPDDQPTQFHRGQIAMYSGDWGESLAIFRSLLVKRPDHYASNYQLGSLLYRTGKLAAAAATFESILRLNPKSQLSRWYLWIVYQQLGGYPADLDAALRLQLPMPKRPAQLPRQAKFTDFAPRLGIGASSPGYGSAWLDYDGDGDLDLFTVGLFDQASLFQNPGRKSSFGADSAGQRFPDRAAELALNHLRGLGAIAADFDNDGDPDIYVTGNGWFGPAANALLRNDRSQDDGSLGGGTGFVDVAATVGVAGEGSSITAVWGDLNNDGFLDLVVANGVDGDGSPNRVYVGDGERFRDLTDASGVEAGQTVGSALGDYDNDGDLDLYLANFNQFNRFYRNDSEAEAVHFTDVTTTTRTQMPLGAHFAFFFDYDNDGHLDLFCSEMSDLRNVVASRVHGRTQRNRHRPSLFRNLGDGSFEDATFGAGLGLAFGTTGAQVGDLNGDGWLDIYLANGGAQMTRLEPDALLLNLGDGHFTDVAPFVAPMQLGKSHGVSFADVDGDGSQEIYLPAGGAYPGDTWPNQLLHSEGLAANWLVVRLQGVQSNRDGIGSRLRVVVAGREQYLEIASGGGSGGSNSLQAEIGLGTEQVVERLEVHWPSGVVDIYSGLRAGDTVDLMEGAGE